MRDIPPSYLWNVTKKLESGMTADEKSKRSVLKNHRIGQPCAIIQNNIM
jgi:hypothetical protein